ncbi:hypothetical protein TrVE_jg5047 [Triparma verrucosa]|uniref:Steroid 5-alpha reductase C-terminal domain-containing protein n=1 Tax=Triparma verrucosa TaxID=1606542 RepID=A0A9W7BIM6_9STRA|nr:hypothetical protein TrVE_jg5047 [Triparma verrucosa]
MNAFSFKLLLLLVVLLTTRNSRAFQHARISFRKSAQLSAVSRSKLAVVSPTSTTLRGGALLPLSAPSTIPTALKLFAASALPTCLGFWKTGYAVSYGYGGAVAAAALLYPSAGCLSNLHKIALVFYGLRLNAFLLYRNVFLPEDVHQMKQKPATLKERAKRLPIILSCSFLYFCLVAPLRVTHLANTPMTGAVKYSVIASLFGFAFGAFGDFWKQVVKATKGKDALVTSGPFALLRHPNYTGELFGWFASFLTAVLAVAKTGDFKANALWLSFSAVGMAGIYFVLAGEAAPGLEKKHQSKYGSSPEYQAWCKRSWAGPMLKVQSK